MGKDKLSKLYMGNINSQATELELRKFMVEHGISENKITGLWLKRGFAFIDCLDQSTADAMIDKIHEKEFQGKKLLLEPSLTSGINQGIRSRVTATVSDQPLKILIPSEYVGAIIGRGGANIKELTMSTGARINILRNRSQAVTAEKTACILGPSENGSAACKKILEICQAEVESGNEGKEVILKILAHNSLIGRIIGKEGRNIKKIMQDTQTKIHVSNQVQSESLESNLWDPQNAERVITIRGSIEGMSNAESLISSKLRVPPMMEEVVDVVGGGGGVGLFGLRPNRFGYVHPGFYPFPISPAAFGPSAYNMTHPFYHHQPYHTSIRSYKSRNHHNNNNSNNQVIKVLTTD